MTTVSDFKKNLNEFYIIDSTLREGEQFINSNFSSAEKKKIACLLNELGIEFLELTNPSTSSQSYEDCKMITQLKHLSTRSKLIPLFSNGTWQMYKTQNQQSRNSSCSEFFFLPQSSGSDDASLSAWIRWFVLVGCLI